MSTLRNRKFYLLYIVGAVMISLTMMLSSCAPSAATAAPTEVPPTEAAPAQTSPTQAAATEATAPTEAPAPTTAPVVEDQSPVVILTSSEPVSFDPMYTQSDAVVIQNMFLTLMWFNDKEELEPQVAESLTNIDDVTWEVKLKQGYTFWDGTPVDADAVVFTLNRGQALFEAGEGDVTFGFNQLNMDHVEKVDDYTIRFYSNGPDPDTPVHLAAIETSILEPAWYTEHDAEYTGQHPMGSGPYEFVSYTPGEGVVFKAYENYRDGVPAVKNIIVKPVPDLSARINELKAGTADVMSGLTPDLFSEIESVPGLQVVNVNGMTRVFVTIKQGRNPALADPLVRQAMNYAVDREGIISSLFGDYAHASCDILDPPYQNPDLQCYPFDPEKAKQLLDQAGWVVGSDGVRAKDGVRLSLNFDTPNGIYMFDKDISQIIAGELQDVGIEIADFQALDWSVIAGMRKNQGEGYRDLMFMGSGADYECADDLLLVEANSGSNRGSWNDPTFEQGFADLKSVFDPQQRLQKCWELEQYAVDQGAEVFLYIQPIFWGVSARLNWNGRPDNRDWWANITYK
jgi:peptide/nickel transport system substrate-binding protein